LADFVGFQISERIVIDPLEALAPILDDVDEGALAGAVADEPSWLRSSRL